MVELNEKEDEVFRSLSVHLSKIIRRFFCV